ncbi:hypothetical protein OAT84_03810 [Gammaproteobacteria bacterium]|nr:hypothetical protein [Gammaproteobacteria bacterium]
MMYDTDLELLNNYVCRKYKELLNMIPDIPDDDFLFKLQGSSIDDLKALREDYLDVLLIGLSIKSDTFSQDDLEEIKTRLKDQLQEVEGFEGDPLSEANMCKWSRFLPRGARGINYLHYWLECQDTYDIETVVKIIKSLHIRESDLEVMFDKLRKDPLLEDSLIEHKEEICLNILSNKIHSIESLCDHDDMVVYLNDFIQRYNIKQAGWDSFFQDKDTEYKSYLDVLDARELSHQAVISKQFDYLQNNATVETLMSYLGCIDTQDALKAFLLWYTHQGDEGFSSYEVVNAIIQQRVIDIFGAWGDRSKSDDQDEDSEGDKVYQWVEENLDNKKLLKLMLTGYAKSTVKDSDPTGAVCQLYDDVSQYDFHPLVAARMVLNAPAGQYVSPDKMIMCIQDYCVESEKLVNQYINHILYEQSKSPEYSKLEHILHYTRNPAGIVAMSRLPNYKHELDQDYRLQKTWWKVSCQNFGYFVRQFVNWLYALIVVAIGCVSIPVAAALSPVLALSFITARSAFIEFRRQSITKDFGCKDLRIL